MSKAVIVESLLAGLVDSSGNPLASGEVYTYEVGTTTPKSLYTDKDASNAAANPLILNSSGAYPAYAYGAYKFVVKTSDDVTVSTLDNLYFTESFTSWVPSISVAAPFTFTSVTIAHAKYLRIGSLILFSTSFSGTAGGTLSSIITMTLPVTSAGNGIAATVQVTDGGAIIGGCSSINTTSSIDIRRYNNANYTAGTVGPTVYGFYEAA